MGVQAFVLSVCSGKWTVDSEQDTGPSWWGYEMPSRKLAHPKAGSGVGKATSTVFSVTPEQSPSLVSILPETDDEVEGAKYAWVDKAEFMRSDEYNHGEHPVPDDDEVHSAQEWIMAAQGSKFLLIFYDDGGRRAYFGTEAYAERYFAAIAEAKRPVARAFKGGLCIRCVCECTL